MEEILNTKTKIRIAKLFVERDESFQISDVAETLGISKSRASECLKDLEERGLLESWVVGRSKLYRLSGSLLAKSIAKALLHENYLLKTIEKSVTRRIKKLRPVSFVLFGSSLNGLKPGRDIDFLLIYAEKVEREKIYEIASSLTQELGFNISILTMSLKEFKRKAKRGEEFVLNVIANHKLLFGKELEDLIW